MSDAVERFNLRKGLGGSENGAEKSAPAAHPVQPCDTALVTILSGRIDDGHPSPQVDPEALLADICGKLDAEKFAALIDSCQRECLEAVIRPFGIGRVLFEDKDGGTVDTVHNVRNNVYATSAEKERYDGRGEYNYYKYHDGNKDFAAAKRNAPEYHDLDHSVACSTIHNDQAVYLADIDGASLANIPQNHQFIGSIDNRAKGKDTVAGFLERLPDLRARQEYAIKIIEERQRRGEATDGELKAAERADKKAYAAEDVADALIPALKQDWGAEIPGGLLRDMYDILSEPQGDIFVNRAQQLDELRLSTAGLALGCELIDAAIAAVQVTPEVPDLLEGVATSVLTSRAYNCGRQIEEHFLRESTAKRAINVRARMEEGVSIAPIRDLARSLLGKTAQPVMRKHNGLDDGVAF